ncbi:MAG: PAC2 family protein [SAR202 cluster bacterium]|nr:PAC2 family protein [Dehalococcoidia bacterium]MQG61208.1 PAC2 family protein [SAR202 cluster bacterium]MQG64959.1 PAC2 family protein [SAR202 cluster bacterium]|tara:strand:+ start:1340 stop:2254 length:915 start_codon:yes stop_codon:yes gene_type:complete
MRIGDFEFTEPLPELKDPHVLAVLRPWIDVGNVGTLSMRRLERHLESKEIGRLVKPGRYYDFTRYRPKSILKQGVREYNIPSTTISTSVREHGPDLITLHLLEPHLYGEDYTDSVIEVLKHFGVKRYSMIGAMYDMVPHTRKLLVSGGTVDAKNEEEYKLVGVRPSDYEGPTTITYLISNALEEMDIETRIFVVHLPQYFQVEEDFTGTARLMEILCTLYGLPSRLADPERGRQQYASLQNIVSDTSEVAGLLERLEERYDRENAEGGASSSPLSPMVEEFLQGLGSKIDLDLDLDFDDDPSDE